MKVLILVVVDNGLVLNDKSLTIATNESLNPCCSGQWSRTLAKSVLKHTTKPCLNPCCSGRWSRTYEYTLMAHLEIAS